MCTKRKYIYILFSFVFEGVTAPTFIFFHTTNVLFISKENNKPELGLTFFVFVLFCSIVIIIRLSLFSLDK